MACPEYLTMVECTVELTEDFSNNLQQIANTLHSKHLISPSVKDEALQSMFLPVNIRAGKLVSVVTNRVQIQPEAFDELVGLLDPRYYSLSLGALKSRYRKNGGKELPLPDIRPHPQIQDGYPPQAPSIPSHQMPPLYSASTHSTMNSTPFTQTSANQPTQVDPQYPYSYNSESVQDEISPSAPRYGRPQISPRHQAVPSTHNTQALGPLSTYYNGTHQPMDTTYYTAYESPISSPYSSLQSQSSEYSTRETMSTLSEHSEHQMSTNFRLPSTGHASGPPPPFSGSMYTQEFTTPTVGEHAPPHPRGTSTLSEYQSRTNFGKSNEQLSGPPPISAPVQTLEFSTPRFTERNISPHKAMPTSSSHTDYEFETTTQKFGGSKGHLTGPTSIAYKAPDLSTPRETSQPISHTQTSNTHIQELNSKTGLEWTPEVKDLLTLERNGKSIPIIARVAAEWESIALSLEIPAYMLRTIKYDFGKTCEGACRNMFQRWLAGEGKGPKSWRTVVEALEDSQENETALLIRELLND